MLKGLRLPRFSRRKFAWRGMSGHLCSDFHKCRIGKKLGFQMYVLKVFSLKLYRKQVQEKLLLIDGI